MKLYVRFGSKADKAVQASRLSISALVQKRTFANVSGSSERRAAASAGSRDPAPFLLKPRMRQFGSPHRVTERTRA